MLLTPALPLLVGLVAPLLPDSPVDWSRRHLELSGNPLGCVKGVPQHVALAPFSDPWEKRHLSWEKRHLPWRNETQQTLIPRCPFNCTIATFYDASADACLPCGAGTFVVGVGAVICSRVATASTVTSSIAALTRCMYLGVFTVPSARKYIYLDCSKCTKLYLS